jgi:hypothetical protein
VCRIALTFICFLGDIFRTPNGASAANSPTMRTFVVSRDKNIYEAGGPSGGLSACWVAGTYLIFVIQLTSASAQTSDELPGSDCHIT